MYNYTRQLETLEQLSLHQPYPHRFLSTETTMTALDLVQDLENYLSKNAMDIMVRDMMVECLKSRPEEPLSWM